MATILILIMVLPLMVPPGDATRLMHQGMSTEVSPKKEPADECNCDNPTEDCSCYCCKCCGGFVLPPHDAHTRHHHP
ncbi:conserved hypothetical protein [Ricinus communis]|uniref:Uncharacterized protein n=1 Tax=Ricinus communis TaxID=3988 RepID=B9RQA4_RICCO|nr:conserved hypothetical protein [Ricinus communis]